MLLFFLTVLSLVGIFLPQIPYETAISPDGYGMWMENVAYSRLGDLAYILEPLGFFSIFRSVWFVGAATALMLNILTCTLTRGRSLRKECKETRIMRDPGFYEEGKFLLTLEAPLSVRRMDERVRRILEARRFSLKKEEGRGCICLAGDKHRYAPLGTLPLHLSLISCWSASL